MARDSELEGVITLRLALEAGRMRGVTIRSTRPLAAASVFRGRPIAEVMNMIPRLYSLCGTAQACAAAEACETAIGAAPDPERWCRRRILVAAETAQEHLWRILCDWPAGLGEAVDTERLAEARRILPAFKQALFDSGGGMPTAVDQSVHAEPGVLDQAIARLESFIGEAVLGVDLANWSALTTTGLIKWWRNSPSLAARTLREVEARGDARLGALTPVFLPVLDVGELEAKLGADDAADFIARPEWGGRPCETTPLARRCGHPLVVGIAKEFNFGLLTRLVARLVELAEIPGEIRALRGADARQGVAPTRTVAAGVGIAQVEAARGRLVHRVELNAGAVHNYQILAPTEWNFHPEGVVRRGLEGGDAPGVDAARRKAEWWVRAVDPCVGHRLVID